MTFSSLQSPSPARPAPTVHPLNRASLEVEHKEHLQPSTTIPPSASITQETGGLAPPASEPIIARLSMRLGALFLCKNMCSALSPFCLRAHKARRKVSCVRQRVSSVNPLGTATPSPTPTSVEQRRRQLRRWTISKVSPQRGTRRAQRWLPVRGI